MSNFPTQIFLRDLDKKLWTAADRLRANLDDAVYSRTERDSLPKAARRVDAEASSNHAAHLSVYGQESDPTTWRLAAMSMAIRGFSADFGSRAQSCATSRLCRQKRKPNSLA